MVIAYYKMFSVLFLSLTLECAGAATLQMLNYSIIPAAECPSSTDLLNGKSRYTYTFKVDTMSAVISLRHTVIFEILRPETSIITAICMVNIHTETCAPNQNITCYCSSKVNSVYEIVLNNTANLDYSNVLLRLVYPDTDPLFDASTYINMSMVYDVAYERLQINGSDYLKGDLSNKICNITAENKAEINWCVYNLGKNYTLEILPPDGSNYTQNCVTKTFYPNGLVNFTLSYLEQSACYRSRSYFCLLNFQQKNFTESYSDAGKGVISAHVICTVFVIILSIIAILILFKTGDFDTYLIILYVAVTIFEIAQIILVIVSATSIDYNLNTSISFWKIMIIYQCLVNFVLIVVDCILLGIKTKCVRTQQKTHLFKFLVALLCVHTVIGLLALPFIIWLVWTKDSVDIRENHSLNDGPVRSQPVRDVASQPETKKPAKPPTVNLAPDEVNSLKQIQINNNQELSHLDKTKSSSEKSDKTKSKSKKKNSSKKNRSKAMDDEEKESTTERSEIDSEINPNSGDLSSIKRLPSIEITSMRKLPPLRKQ